MSLLKKQAAATEVAAAHADSAPAPEFEGLDEQQAAAPAPTPAPEVKAEKTTETKQQAKAEKAAEAPAPEAEQKPEAEEPAAEEPAAEAPAGKSLIANPPGKHMLAAMTGGNVSPLKDLQGAFEKAGIEISFSTFPRMRNEAGVFSSVEGEEAGNWIELQVISYSPSWVVTPGGNDKSDEAKKAVRYSNDGKTIQSASDNDEYAGMSCEEYRQVLVEKGYEGAAVKEYLNVYGLVLDCDDDSFKHRDEIVSLSLAPLSRSKFDGYVMQRAMRARMGRVQETSANPVVRFTAERAKAKNGDAFFNSIPSDGQAQPIDMG